MTNIFKSNSRFAGLTDDLPVNKDKKNNTRDRKNDIKDDKIKDDNKIEKSIDKFNSFKDERHDDRFTLNRFKNNTNNGFSERRYGDGRRYDEKEIQRYREQREAEEKSRIEFEVKERERLTQEALKIDNFPDLVVQNKKDKKENEISMSFIEKIKKEREYINDSISKDPDLINLKRGWVVFKCDPITHNIIVKKHPRDIEKENEEILNLNKYEQERIKEAFKQLANLHEKRTNEYIEMYGYDTWEKLFKCPNWREFEAEFDDESDEEYEDEQEEYQDEEIEY